MPANVHGYRMKYFVKETEDRLGKVGLEKLQKEYGDLNFIPSKEYSETENVKLLRAFTKVVFGNEDPKSLFETGRILAKRELDSLIIKIGLRVVPVQRIFKGLLFNPSVLTLIEQAIPKYAPSLQMKIENPDPKTLVLTFVNTQMPPKIYEGEWYEIFTHWVGEVKTESQALTATSFKIILSTDNFKKLEDYLSKTQ